MERRYFSVPSDMEKILHISRLRRYSLLYSVIFSDALTASRWITFSAMMVYCFFYVSNYFIIIDALFLFFFGRIEFLEGCHIVHYLVVYDFGVDLGSG